MTIQEKGDQHLEQENENNQPPRDQRELLNSLSANIYQLYELQKHLYGDVKKFSEASQEFMSFHQTLKGTVKDFSLLAPEVKRQIREMVYTSVRETLKQQEVNLGEALVATAGVETNKLVQSLNISVRNAESALVSYLEQIEWSGMKSVATGVLCGFCIVMSFILFMVFRPFAFVSPGEIDTYESGQLLEKVWPRLTGKERKRIEELAIAKFN